MDITTLTGVGLISFGGVWILNNVYKRFYKHEDLSSEGKFALAFVIALVWGFIPPDLGAVWANHVKDAIGIATGFAGGYQFTSKVAEKV